MKRLESQNKLLKTQEQQSNQRDIEVYRQAAGITGFNVNNTVFLNNTGIQVENWKRKYHPDRFDPDTMHKNVEKLQNIINDAKVHKISYKDTRAHAFGRIAAFIDDTKQYIQGHTVDTIDKSLRELQAIYEGLESKASPNPAEKDVLILLESLKAMEIVKDPEPLYQQYALGGIESINRYHQVMSTIQIRDTKQQQQQNADYGYASGSKPAIDTVQAGNRQQESTTVIIREKQGLIAAEAKHSSQSKNQESSLSDQRLQYLEKDGNIDFLSTKELYPSGREYELQQVYEPILTADTVTNLSRDHIEKSVEAIKQRFLSKNFTFDYTAISKAKISVTSDNHTMTAFRIFSFFMKDRAKRKDKIFQEDISGNRPLNAVAAIINYADNHPNNTMMVSLRDQYIKPVIENYMNIEMFKRFFLDPTLR